MNISCVTIVTINMIENRGIVVIFGRFLNVQTCIRCIKLFLNRQFLAKKIAVPTVPRKVISFSIPFLGIDSQKIKGKLIRLAEMYFPFFY